MAVSREKVASIINNCTKENEIDPEKLTNGTLEAFSEAATKQLLCIDKKIEFGADKAEANLQQYLYLLNLAPADKLPRLAEKLLIPRRKGVKKSKFVHYQFIQDSS